MEQMNRLLPQNFKAFVTGGNATVIIYSSKTNYQHRYYIKAATGTANLWYVTSAMFMDKRTMRPLYLGHIRQELKLDPSLYPQIWFAQSTKTIFEPKDKKAIEAFDWSFRKATREPDTWPEHIVLYHTGKCSVCGRPLTDAVSLSLGIGPKCRGER